GFDYDDIAASVGKSVTAVHQVAHRARAHVQARRRRFQPVDAAKTAQVTEEFMTAAATGDMAGLLTLLAPNVTWTADSGGKATAARRPMVGAQKVATLLMDLFRTSGQMPGMQIQTANCNNTPALVAHIGGDQPEGVLLMQIIDGKITNFYAIRNPDKLVAMTVVRQISR
ncbi:RNA polymerase subunit sigma-24, partial [Plantactinospora endophytica]